MLYWIIQITLISIILIFLVHHLIHFFKTTLTVPKLKDLVNSPTEKYENIFNIIKKTQNDNKVPSNISYTINDLLPTSNINAPVEEPSMKNELKNFLKKQLNDTNSSTEISTLDSMIGTQNFASFN
jgi:uncharacterized protein (UPF0147 family)